MKTAVHYAMTPEGDEVWVILTWGEHAAVEDCLELARRGDMRDTAADVVAVFSRTALRAANRFIAERVSKAGGIRACRRELAELHNRLRYEADRLRRAETTPESVFVAEARASLPLRQEA